MNRPPRLSRRGARRLLDGRPANRPREQRLAEFLNTLADREAPDGEIATQGATDRDGTGRDAAAREAPDGEIAGWGVVPPPVLEAFARQAGDSAAHATSPARSRPVRSGARSAVGSRPIRRTLTVKAAVVLALSGATVAAAAAADALPEPAQRAAYELLGSWGVPAPGPHHPGPAARPVAPATTARPGGVRGPGAAAGAGHGRHRRAPGPGSAPAWTACATDSAHSSAYGGADGGWDGPTHAVPGGADGTGYTYGYGYGYGVNGIGAGHAFGHACPDPSDGLPGRGAADGGATSSCAGPCPSPSASASTNATAADPDGSASAGRSIPTPSPGHSRTHRPHTL